MRIQKILAHQLRNILAGMCLQDAEEIVSGGDFAVHLRGVVFEEGDVGRD